MVKFAVIVVKMILPNRFHIPRVDPAVAVRGFLDEHHWWKVIDVPGA
jgi:hypothetical protein